MKFLIKISILMTLILTSACALFNQSQRNINTVSEPIIETIPYMPHHYEKEERRQLNMATDTEAVKYLRSLKIKQRVALQEEDSRKLTQGYYYCDRAPAKLTKFREEDRYFSRTLQIKNPFIYLENQYDPAVKNFVENENLNTYQSLACDETYSQVLKELLEIYNLKLFEYNANHKLNKVYSYEGLAYKNLSWSKTEPKSAIEFENDELAEETAKDQKGETTVENKALGSIRLDRPLLFLSQFNILGWHNNTSDKYGYKIVPFFLLKFKSKIRNETNEQMLEDIRNAQDNEKYSVEYVQQVYPKFVSRYSDDQILIAKVNTRGTEIVKLSYNLKTRKVISKTVVFLNLGDELRSIEIGQDGLLGIASRTYDSSEIRFYSKENKLIFSKKYTTPYTKILVHEDRSLVVIETTLEMVTANYKFNAENKTLEKVYYNSKSDQGLSKQIQTYRAVKNEKYPFIVFQRSGVAPKFIHLSFYGGFFIESAKTISTHENFLLARGGVVVKTFLRGDKDLGFVEWNKARFEGKLDTVQDILLLTQALQTKYPDLKNKIFIEGWSNGGMLALRAALERPELFAGVISGAPDADLIEFNRLSDNGWEDEYGNFDKLRTLEKMSPYHQAISSHKKLPPIFIRTAYDDLNVNPANSFKMLAALRNNHTGGPFFLMTRPFGAGHGAETTQAEVEEYSYIYRFILKTLSEK